MLSGGECFVLVNNERIHDAMWGITTATVTVKAGDYVHIANAKLTKIS